MMNPEVSLATVMFWGDLRLTVLQALSIDRLFSLDGVSEYVVVANDIESEQVRSELENHLHRRLSRELWGKLRIIERSDLPRGGSGQGWHGQQVVKLALADYVSSGHYLMFDAKNHFVRKSSVDDFFHAGKPKTVFTKTSATWDKYVRSSLEAMDGLTEERASRMMPTTTPYLMIANEVQRLIWRLETKYELPLDDAIRKTGWATEFFLYYAHLVTSYEEIPYANQPPMTRTLFTSWPQEHWRVLEKIAEAASGVVPMFGLHRNRLPQLSRAHQAAIVDMWRSCDLLKQWEDAYWFLENDF